MISVVAVGLCGIAVSSCSRTASISRNPEILLVPQVNAGWAGWCVIGVGERVGGCPPGQSHPPILAESWGSGGPPSATLAYAVATARVRSVAFDGEPPIPTQAESGLPDNLRAVVVEIPGKELLSEDKVAPRFTPLDANGEPIAQSAEADGDPQASMETLGIAVPSRGVSNPMEPTSGVCRINAMHLAGLAAQGGSVISRVPSYSGLIGRGFLSCASTSYSLNGWPLLAGILLNASRPGALPSALSAMKPLPGPPGIFHAPGPEGPGTEGELLARRVHGAWLVVARGDPQLRLSLLEHLRATVHL